MDVKIILGIVLLSVLAFVIGVFIPGGKEQVQTLPWQIETTAEGSTRVFGLTLGASTLQDAEVGLQATSEVSLFSGQQKHLVEAYFDKVDLGGLSARVVLVMDFPEPALQAMYQRGARISTLGSGANKVTLATQDLAQVMQAPIASIAYLPRIALDESLLVKRFGEPAERITEVATSTTHWLYPLLGLDIALDEKGHAVFQYVRPDRFSTLAKPLSKLPNKK